MDIFITVIDADDSQPVTIRVGSIGTMKRVEPTSSSDPDMGAYTRIEMAADDPIYIRAVETVDQILFKVAESLAATQKVIAGANQAVATSAMGEVMKVVRDLMPLIRGGGVQHAEPAEPMRRNCSSCRHKAVALTDEPCVSCRVANDYPKWEQE